MQNAARSHKTKAPSMLKPCGKGGPTSTEENLATPESKLHPLYFKAYVKKCVSKLSNCQNTRDEFLLDYLFDVPKIADVQWNLTK